MNKAEFIKNLLEKKSDDDLKKLIVEYQILQNTGLLPEVSEFAALTRIIGTVFETNKFNTTLTMSFLTDEVFTRYLKQK